ncbi:2876_t:CDS:2 [Cetraspora pellucida]|uniref:2876_t:CDS:1 n=1 Tax=Cetraspora pellucida TaxID=1433469 RepID=A0A9N9K1J5_9GLOM|nr:2876_t:CDS:2 [Cetraspora pellucida]
MTLIAITTNASVTQNILNISLLEPSVNNSNHNQEYLLISQATNESLANFSKVASNNKTNYCWTSFETRILIEEVSKNQYALQQIRDPREKEHIWDKIISNIQDSTSSLILKEQSKISFQQK